MTLYSHPKSPLHPEGKRLEIHVGGVYEKALKKIERTYSQYNIILLLQYVAFFHDIGKTNSNFQEYIFRKDKSRPYKKYKQHSFPSAIILFEYLQKKQIPEGEYLQYVMFYLIIKHHTSLHSINKSKAIDSNSVISFTSFLAQADESLIFEQNVNEFIKSFDEKSPPILFKNCEDLLGEFDVFKYKFRKYFVNIAIEQRHELFLIIQFSFSVLIESDKRDAGDMETFEFEEEEKAFSTLQYNKLLDDYIERTFSIKKDSYSLLKSEIKNSCIKEIKNGLQADERVFEVIAPTGSGKTILFLSLAGEIKKYFNNKPYKVIYTLPFLSITDQVYEKVQEIFLDAPVFRIDSAGESKSTQDSNEEDDLNLTSQEKIAKYFSEDIFDHAFIITTFVKLFHTFTSNKNKDLLRLNNLSKSIIIIDEVQALPPRTYTFFIAHLTKFAKLFDCFILIGSATKPVFELPTMGAQKFIGNESRERKLRKSYFSDYTAPFSLLKNYSQYYQNQCFDRYHFYLQKEPQTINEFYESSLQSLSTYLCILNTVKSSQELYKLARKNKKNVYLLNSNFTLEDRRIILEKALTNESILITTQLIEAGVDISFEKVFRDFAPLPSLIQSAGRCNRINNPKKGNFTVKMLHDQSGKDFAGYIYKDADLLSKTKSLLISDYYSEKDLLSLQEKFYNDIKENLAFSRFTSKYNSSEYYLDQLLYEFSFEELSYFNLIDDEETLSVFIIKNEQDEQDFEYYKSVCKNENPKKIEIEKARKKISNREIQLRFRLTHDSDSNYALIEMKSREEYGVSYFSVANDSLIGTYDFQVGNFSKDGSLDEDINLGFILKPSNII